MGLPQQPSETGYFPPQHGYDPKVKTHKYDGKPTPIKAEQGKASEFFANHTDKEHQKKYAKEGGKRLFKFLLNAVCK